MPAIIPANPSEIGARILLLRGQRVLLDVDVAGLYGVTTSRLNEQVKRNRDRFPRDFMFRLTPVEKSEVIANCDHLRRLKFAASLPFAFTEHGAIMLASVLNSAVAVRTSTAIVRAFVRMREALAAHADLAAKVDLLERRYDRQFKVVFDAIRALMRPPPRKRPARIGFKPDR